MFFKERPVEALFYKNMVLGWYFLVFRCFKGRILVLVT